VTAASAPGYAGVRDILARSAERAPDSTAIITDTGEHSFRELVEAAKVVSAQLIPDTRVVIRMANDAASIVAVHAAWLAGCSIVSASTMVPDVEVQRRVNETCASAVLRPSESDLTVVVQTTDVQAPAPDGEALVMFTSGTTGTPKGASLTFDSLRGSLVGIALGAGLDAEGRAPRMPARGPRLVLVPIAHMGGFLGSITAWWLGKPALLVAKFSGERVIDLAQRHRIGIMGMTPAMVWELAQMSVTPKLPGVHSVTVGTAALPEATRIAFEEKFGIPVLRNYGQTEFAGAIAFERQSDVAAGIRPPDTVGRVAPGVEVVILDEAGNSLPTGSTGEIAARAASAMSGYLGVDGRPEITEGWLRTGDLGKIDGDGFVYVVGRVRDVLVCGGFNVYPAQVEAALNELPDVADSAVSGLPDDRLGEIPVATVVLNVGSVADTESLRRELRSKLAAYELPRRIAVVDAIPRRDTGKVDRDAVGRIVESQCT
jgi:long-chain acyl-CoA synthetase